MHVLDLARRRLMLASMALPTLPLLPGCAVPRPVSMSAATTPAARALLGESAAAHGLAALAQLTDVKLRYGGESRPLILKTAATRSR